jgi:DNA processing protein
MVSASSQVLEGPQLPPGLLDLAVPPVRVHVTGELPRGPTVAIVGTRKPSKQAWQFAFRLAANLARAGVVVVSGGALGIDSAAHLGALRGRGATMVIAPAGYWVPYPAKNAALFRSILRRDGAYLSLVGDAVVAQTSSFFARNAALVALSHALVVVEAPFRSGARNAARWARRLGRPLFIVPSAPWSRRGRGSLQDLERGALPCVRAENVLRELERRLSLPEKSLNVPKRKPRRSKRGPPAQQELAFLGSAQSDGEELRRVLAAIDAGARALDAICERTGLPASAAQRHVLTLTLEGVLGADPGGLLARSPAAQPVSRRK